MRNCRCLGFTLLELIIVVFLMGLVAAGFVLMTTSSNQNHALEREAQRFAEILSMSTDLAIMEGHTLGIYIEPERYRFMIYQQQTPESPYRWQWLEKRRFNTDVELPESMTLTLTAEQGFWANLADENVSSNFSTMNRDEFSLHDKDAEPLPEPQIEVEPTGLLTPFSLRVAFEHGDDEHTYIVRVSRMGEVVIVNPQHEKEDGSRS